MTIDVAPLNAEELAILRPIIEGATGKFAWSAIEMRQMLATIDAAYEERDRLRAALKRIAFEDELVYLGCADMPFCHDPHTNTEQCPVAVARAALEGRE